MNRCRFCQEPARDLVLSHGKNSAVFLSLKNKPVLRYIEHQTSGIEKHIVVKISIKDFKFCTVCGNKLGDK